MKKNLALLAVVTLCFSSKSQQTIFALSNSPNDLYAIDLENCSRTFIGNTNQQFGDIACTTDGRLWGITGGVLYEINPLNAVSVAVGVTNTNAVSLVGLNDSTLLAESDFLLYAINVHSAQATNLGAIGFQAAGDLTWYDNDLYIVTGYPGIIKITLNASNTAIASVTPIENLMLPNCEGAVTASFVNDYNSIVGFNAEDAIKICRLDGTFDVLCADLNLGGTPGAASMRLANQNPMPNSCLKTNALEENGLSVIQVYPNPSMDQIVIELLNTTDLAKFELIDQTGRILQKGVLNAGKNLLNTQVIPAGSYNVKVYFPTGVGCFSLIFLD